MLVVAGPRPRLAQALVLRLVAASSVGPGLSGPARPVELWERGQRGCQGLGGCAWRRAGMVPCLGASGIWLLSAPDVFEASYLIGPGWLPAILLARSGREGSPEPTLAALLSLQVVGKVHRPLPLPSAPLLHPEPLFPPRPHSEASAESSSLARRLASLSLSLPLREMGVFFPCSSPSQDGEGLAQEVTGPGKGPGSRKGQARLEEA